MNKFLAFLLSFFILNSSFAEELLCPCCYNNYFKDYQDGKSFATDGLDVYVVDDFTDNVFVYYNHFFEGDKEDLFLPKEQYNIDAFSRKEDPSNELHFSSHKNPWYWHFYKKNKKDKLNDNLIENLAKKMSTKGGNNFDWDKGVDKFRIFERFRSKVRHNKNVILVKLESENDPLFKETIFTFRKFVNMSYVPVPIIFTGKFDYSNFENDLESYNNAFTTEYCQNENNIVIHRGIVDKTQAIDPQKCLYIKQDTSFVDRVKKELEKACYYHNFKDDNYNGETLNIAVIGLPRSGKSLFTNTILNKLSAKVANDMISVTQGKTSFSHSNVKNIPIRIIDTPGFEGGNNSVPSFINWLLCNDKGNSDKKRIDNIHVIVYFINAKNFPNPKDFGNAWIDSAGISRINEFYLEEEIDLFKIFKDNKVPVVFVIAQSHSFENGYKYLKKWFGDLALINELSNYKSNEDDWEAENQWICPEWTRGCLIQLKNDPIEGSLDYTGKYGFVKLMNIIENLFDSNVEYRNRLPDVFQNQQNLKIILGGLKIQLITQQGFIDDASKAPVWDKGEDLIVREVDEKIPACLSLLHSAYIENPFAENLIMARALKKAINAFTKGVESFFVLGKNISFQFE